MNQLFEIISGKNAERDAALSELKKKTVFANQVMQDVYSNREGGLNLQRQML